MLSWFFVGHCYNRSHSESVTTYRAGFNDCASKVISLMENQPHMDTKLREQILVRLAASCNPLKPDVVYYSSSASQLYQSQKSTDFTAYCSMSSPPPSPPSSAFIPYQVSNKAVKPLETGSKTSRECHSSTHTNNASEESRLPLWRPWMSS